MKIPMTECKDGWLYIIRARNSSLGIYEAKSKGFIIRREKFGSVFLFTEYHWDTGAPHGTASPIKELFQVQDDTLHASEDELILYLYQQAHKRQDEIEEEVRIDQEWIQKVNHENFTKALEERLELPMEKLQAMNPRFLRSLVMKKMVNPIVYDSALGEESKVWDIEAMIKGIQKKE